jgi:hypothetical protein
VGPELSVGQAQLRSVESSFTAKTWSLPEVLGKVGIERVGQYSLERIGRTVVSAGTSSRARYCTVRSASEFSLNITVSFVRGPDVTGMDWMLNAL